MGSDCKSLRHHNLRQLHQGTWRAATRHYPECEDRSNPVPILLHTVELNFKRTDIALHIYLLVNCGNLVNEEDGVIVGGSDDVDYLIDPVFYRFLDIPHVAFI